MQRDWIGRKLIDVTGVLIVGAVSAASLLAQERNGSIHGTVQIPAQVQVVPRMVHSSGYRTAAPPPAASEKTQEKPEVTNVVVFLEGKGLERIEGAKKTPILDQRDASFIPHVLPIVRGTSVRIVNRDRTYHNVFSLSAVKKFNIGRRPTGEEVPVTFDKTGIVKVFCDIHSNMSAIILVLDNPVFVQPSDDGSFDLPDVPPGQYTIRAWHERFTAPPQQITVRPGETATTNFDFQ